MIIITVFNKPSDYPDEYVARIFHVRFNDKSKTSEVIPSEKPLAVHSDYSEIIKVITKLDPYLIRMGRQKDDNLAVVETWI